MYNFLGHCCSKKNRGKKPGFVWSPKAPGCFQWVAPLGTTIGGGGHLVIRLLICKWASAKPKMAAKEEPENNPRSPAVIQSQNALQHK